MLDFPRHLGETPAIHQASSPSIPVGGTLLLLGRGGNPGSHVLSALGLWGMEVLTAQQNFVDTTLVMSMCWDSV